MSKPALVIDMNPRWIDCHVCGGPDECRWGVPIFNGDIVSDDFQGDWGGVAVCRECFARHAAGLIETFDDCYMGPRGPMGVSLWHGAGI